MSPEDFLKEFGHLAATEGGIAQLRELVLSLGLTGGFQLGREGDDSVVDLLRRRGCEPLEASDALPKRWALVTLPMIAEQRLGKMLDKAKNSGDLRPYLRNLNVQWFRFELGDVLEMRLEDEEVDEFLLKDGDLLVCEGGEPGRAAIWKDTGRPMFFQKALHRIRPIPEVLPEFLAYRFRLDTWNGRLEKLFTGATIKHLTGRSLKGHQFPLPPLPEQKRIVEKVDQLMALCDELEAKQKEKREKAVSFNKAALSAVVHAPDKSKLKSSWSRVQDHFEVLYELPENVKELRGTIEILWFGGRFSEGSNASVPQALLSGYASNAIGTENWGALVSDGLPQGWAFAPLELICPTFVDSAHRTPTYSEHGAYPALRPRDIALGTLRLKTAAKVNAEEYERQTLRRRPIAGDIVYSRELSLGWAVILPDEPSVCLSQGMLLMRPQPIVSSEYLTALLNSPLGRWQSESAAVGAAHPHINLKEIRRFCFPIPPSEEQLRILRRVSALAILCDDLEAKLAQHRDQGQRLMRAVVESLVA